jgi:hypothetical protein
MRSAAILNDSGGRHSFGWTKQPDRDQREEIDGEIRVRERGFWIDRHAC